MNVRPNDKVRLKVNGNLGARGIVIKVQGAKLVIRIDGQEKLIHVKTSEVTNFSLAARKAWVSMPVRPVGRKKGVRFCDRISVTLRIDRELWERFQTDEESGLIDDRTETINTWLKEQLDALEKNRV